MRQFVWPVASIRKPLFYRQLYFVIGRERSNIINVRFKLFKQLINYFYYILILFLVKLIACDGELASLHCPPYHQIVIESANFGRFALKECNPTKRPDFNIFCNNPQAIDVLRARLVRFLIKVG